ncbi:MAG: hypothetical protein H6Q52_1503 [Deltaproteobacteria bacterium]|nr:hypothetical protein [Deltaproteobacteria bacterium]
MVPVPPFSVKMDITDVLYLTYLVPEKRLRPAVPGTIPFAMTYEGNTFISLVVFHNLNVRTSFFPFVRFNYDQINVRTYIRDPVTGQTAVFFLHSGITSRVVSFITRLLKIPWPAMSLTIGAAYENDTVKNYSAEGDWAGEVHIHTGDDTGRDHDYAPFRDIKGATEFLTTPTVGFYAASGGVIRFEVEHASVMPSGSDAASVRFPMLEALGYVTRAELQHPHSALITPHAFFRVMLPPRLITV